MGVFTKRKTTMHNSRRDRQNGKTVIYQRCKKVMLWLGTLTSCESLYVKAWLQPVVRLGAEPLRGGAYWKKVRFSGVWPGRWNCNSWPPRSSHQCVLICQRPGKIEPSDYRMKPLRPSARINVSSFQIGFLCHDDGKLTHVLLYSVGLFLAL